LPSCKTCVSMSGAVCHVSISPYMTIESTITFGVSTANFVPNPIRPEWILDGSPVARTECLSNSPDGMAGTYLWDCTAGRFNWFYSFDETLHILEGAVTLKGPNGKVRRVSAGDTIYFPAGSSAEWTVEKYVLKIAFCRTPLPPYLVFARGIARKVKRTMRGGRETEGGSGLL
jgi:uncharacterized cupin superfamily protein